MLCSEKKLSIFERNKSFSEPSSSLMVSLIFLIIMLWLSVHVIGIHKIDGSGFVMSKATDAGKVFNAFACVEKSYCGI